MFYVFGSRLYGKVDEVPGMFHVATKFGHLNFVPLFPMQSYVVLSQSGKTFRGVPIPMSGKSVLVTWGRAIGFLAAVIGGVATLVMAADPRRNTDWTPFAALLVIGLILCGFLFFFKGVKRAGFNRACELGRLVGLNERAMAEVHRIYGQSAGRGFEVTPAGRAAYPQPAYGQPAYAQPAYAQPVHAQPVYSQPAYAQPTSAQPAYAQPEPAFSEDDDDRGAYAVAGEGATTFWLRGTHRQSGQAVCVPVVAGDGRQARAMGNAQGIDVATVQYQDGRLA